METATWRGRERMTGLAVTSRIPVPTLVLRDTGWEGKQPPFTGLWERPHPREVGRVQPMRDRVRCVNSSRPVEPSLRTGFTLASSFPSGKGTAHHQLPPRSWLSSLPCLSSARPYHHLFNKRLTLESSFLGLLLQEPN